ncbi:MAG: AEC family transporter [Mariniblastus sp.]
MQILNSLVPIFSVIGLGFVLRRFQFLSDEATQAFNRFAYFFALPLFLFYKLAAAPTGTGTANLFLATLLGASVVTAIFMWGLTWAIGTNRRSRGAMIQAGFRGNLAFMALPLIFFVTSDLAEDHRAQIESAVLIALAPVVIFYSAASVAALAVYNEETESEFSWRSVWLNIVFNPLLVACVFGFAFQQFGWPVPVAAVRTCSVVGSAAFPLALLGIGSQLASISISGQWSSSILSSVVKCIVCPLVGWMIGLSIGLSGIELRVILIMCAVPTAVSSYVLADQMKGDADLAASSVVICTVFSLFSLSVLLALPF